MLTHVERENDVASWGAVEGLLVPMFTHRGAEEERATQAAGPASSSLPHGHATPNTSPKRASVSAQSARAARQIDASKLRSVLQESGNHQQSYLGSL